MVQAPGELGIARDMKNHVKDKIRRGKSVTGIWSIIPSPMVSEIIATSGLDFMILDMEHGAFDMTVLAECIRSAAGTECSPIVRVPYVEPTLIQRVLDAGAHGIIAPQVRSRDDAEFLVSCCRFSPNGLRGYNPFTRAGNFLSDHKSTYLENGFPFISLIIENLDAYKDLDGLLEVKDIDAYYLGIYDMSCAFGSRGDLESSSIKHFVAESSARISAAGKAIGRMIDRRPPVEADGDATFFYVMQPDAFLIKQAIISRL
jgi:4-hydroxy-2-oxoheptanedioate aldolase